MESDLIRNTPRGRGKRQKGKKKQRSEVVLALIVSTRISAVRKQLRWSVYLPTWDYLTREEG